MRRLRDAVWRRRLHRALREGQKIRERQYRAELALCVMGDPERADRAWAAVLQTVGHDAP